MKTKKRKKKYTKERRILELRIKFGASLTLAAVLLFLVLFRGPIGTLLHGTDTNAPGTVEQGTEKENVPDGPFELAPDEDGANLPLPEFAGANKMRLEEEDIYSFLQGPRGWNSKSDWSGEWCQANLQGGLFSVFGCGLCDLASIYGTMTPYECSPIDMYYFAREVSGYSPSSGAGAIDWPYLVETLAAVGITSEVYDKDETYEEFAQAMEAAVGGIALVSSYDDNSYWPDTEGHYVNIWCYNKDTQMVFLGDSGNPAHNRAWIPLSTVYSALKTSGSHQYLLCYSYDEAANTWKHDGIDADWAPPDYYKN